MRWLIHEIRIFSVGLALFAFLTLAVAFGIYFGSSFLQYSQDEQARSRYVEIQGIVHKEMYDLKQQVAALQNDLETLAEKQSNMANVIGELQQIKPSLDQIESQVDALARQVAQDTNARNTAAFEAEAARRSEILKEIYIANRS
jgi:uncharacterized protein YoxC